MVKSSVKNKAKKLAEAKLREILNEKTKIEIDQNDLIDKSEGEEKDEDVILGENEELDEIKEHPISDDDSEGDKGEEMDARRAHEHSGKNVIKRKKYHPAELKVILLNKLKHYGYELCSHVDAHTGNSLDPFVLLQLKNIRYSVPVPPHWEYKRSFLSTQTNREVAQIIPQEVADTNVRAIMREKAIDFDIAKFARCFLTGNPLSLKTFGVQITPLGDTFKEGRWRPTSLCIPGVISDGLRYALGIETNHPPPWLHEMQRHVILPPSYPSCSIPGMNSPIPNRAEWGYGFGQWGQPPRDANGGYLYPEVDSRNSSGRQSRAFRAFGVVPPRVRIKPTADGMQQLQKNEAKTPVATSQKQPISSSPADGGYTKVMMMQPAPISPPPQIQPRTGSALPMVMAGEYLKEFVSVDDLGTEGALLIRRSVQPRFNIVSDLANQGKIDKF